MSKELKRKSEAFPREKTAVVLNWVLKATNRSSQRRALAQKWLAEGPYSKYKYFVETCEDGKRIYLRRPTYLNKGFDFQVNVEGFGKHKKKARGVTKEMPSHPDVFRDLKGKVKAHKKLRNELYRAVCDVYDCTEPDEVISKRSKLRGITKGLPLDKILRIIKWLFIEQDLTYWLGTGRNRLMSCIERKVFKIKSELCQE